MDMRRFWRSFITAAAIVVAVQILTMGFLAPRLPRVLGRPAVRSELEKSWPAAPRFALHNKDGSVQVRVHKADTIAISAEIRAYTHDTATDEDAATYVASLVAAELKTGELRLTTEPKERPDTVDVRVDYTVLVPPDTDVSIEGSNGNVWISKGCGQVTVAGRNADIEIVEPLGPVEASSTNGRIRLVDAMGDTKLSTVNGSIYAHMVGGRLEAETSNGSIVANLLRPAVEAMTLRTQNGGITLVMHEGCSGHVTAQTELGVVHSDWPVDCRNGCESRRHLQGIIGKGHTEVYMNTLNGNIWIARSGA